MMRVQCPHCGAKLRVSERQAGKEGSCPRCRKRLTIPSAPEPELKLVQEDTGADARIPSKLLDQLSVRPPPPRTDKDRDSREPRLAPRRPSVLRSDIGRQHTGARRLPWFIDVLLYPASLSGIIALGAIVLSSLWEYFVVSNGWYVGRLVMPGGLLGLYLGWYLAECVYDSAQGGTRAPEIFDAGGDWDDLASRVVYLVAVYVLFALPPVLYRVVAGRSDAVFWGLMAWGTLFLPMGLLAMVIHDSASVLNPLFLLGAIARVPRPYLGLLRNIAGLVGVFWYGNALLLRRGLTPATLILVNILAGSYAAFILAHALGRFYWRHRDRLDWGI
jgi:predicted Zn finger-like uncharacterized protein